MLNGLLFYLLSYVSSNCAQIVYCFRNSLLSVNSNCQTTLLIDGLPCPIFDEKFRSRFVESYQLHWESGTEGLPAKH